MYILKISDYKQQFERTEKKKQVRKNQFIK